MLGMLKLLFLVTLIAVMALSVLFVALIIVCSFVGAGTEACRCLGRWLSSRTETPSG